MTPTGTLPMFDGHNDTLLRLHTQEEPRSFFERSNRGHVDLPRILDGGLAGGFFAIFVPSNPAPEDDFSLTGDGYAVRMDPPLDPSYARDMTMAMMADLFEIETASEGQVKVVRTADDMAGCIASGVIAVILHFEGAEAIDPDLAALDTFYQPGLRSLGIVWSRPNMFAEGVPFRFPHSPDTGPGLTGAGRDLVRACNQLGIMIDLSHINERGFWDVAGLSTAPLVASHSNAYALCPVTRNLTDSQLDAIGESGGLVGVTYDVSMLREDSYLEPDTDLNEIVRHVDYIVERIGIECVGLGSDFDGATILNAIGDVSGLPNVVAAFRERGYDERTLRKLASENWIRVLGQTWSE